MAKVTLQSIADQLGVSRMSVSNAFSRPDQLSDALRAQILAVASDLGYTGPDPSARSLARGTTGTIGVLWSSRLRYSLSDEISARFLGAIADELTVDGLALTLLPSRVEGDVVAARDVAMDGAIAYSCPPDLPALQWLERRRLPMVHVDMAARRGVAAITIDDRGGARAAAEHLLALGHRSFAVVASGLGDAGIVGTSLAEAAAQARSWVIGERLKGWLDALDPAGVATVLASQPNSYEDARPVARALLQLPDRPTAVLCLTDTIAHDVLAVAAERGLGVPDDLSVVGFDDHPLAARSRPALTTVHQDVDAKGRAAAAALRAVMVRREDAAAPRPRGRRLPVKLVIREGTGPRP